MPNAAKEIEMARLKVEWYDLLKQLVKHQKEMNVLTQRQNEKALRIKELEGDNA